MGAIPATMRALVQRGDGYAQTATGPLLHDAADWLELATIPVPEVGEGQALVRLRRAAVNPSDIHFIKGEYGQPRVRGQAAGFEGCGDVVAGPDHLLGKRVAFAVGAGAWAQYAVVDAQACIPLHPAISDNDGAGQIVNPMTARAMIGLAKEAGDAVVITAAGSQLGKLMISLAKDMGVKTIATVRRDLDLDADVVLNTQNADFRMQASAAMAELKPRMMLDAVCDQSSEVLFTLMPNRARWVCYGKLSTEFPALTQMGQLIFMGKRIEGFWLSQWFRDADPAAKIAAVTDVQTRFADGRWRTDVAAELPLDQVIKALADALRLPDGKTIISFS